MNKAKTAEPLFRQETNFEYYGAGVPVVISVVELESFGSDWIPLLDYEKLEDILARKVGTKSTRLTGNDVRFLRQWLEISMADLAECFGYTAPAVHRWQQRRSRPAGMHWTAEIQLRLLVLDKLGVSPTVFRKSFRDLLVPLPEAPETPIRISGARVASQNHARRDIKRIVSKAKPSSHSRHAA